MTLAELHFPSDIAIDGHHHINEEANYMVKGVFETISDNVTKIYLLGDLLHIESNKIIV